jgi:2-iminobutanoate/2-iminopropanoate deaminase
LTNIAAILEEAGSSIDKIVSVTVVLADEDDFAGMNEEWLRWFPSNPPARQGAKLPTKIPGLKVSIAASEAYPLSTGHATACVNRPRFTGIVLVHSDARG